jgi:hypothetical protein
MMNKTKYGVSNLKINTDMGGQYLSEGKGGRLMSPGYRVSVKNTLSPPKSNPSGNHAFIYQNGTNDSKKAYDDRSRRSNSRCNSGTGYRRYEEGETKKYAANFAFSPQSAKLLKHSKTPSSSKFTPLSTRHNSIDNEYLGDTPGGEGQEVISVMSLLGQNQSPLTIKNLSFQVAGFETTKHSVKSMNTIKAYAANTHQGIVR